MWVDQDKSGVIIKPRSLTASVGYIEEPSLVIYFEMSFKQLYKYVPLYIQEDTLLSNTYYVKASL